MRLDSDEEFRDVPFKVEALVHKDGSLGYNDQLVGCCGERAKRRLLLVNRLVLRRADEAIVDVVISSFIRGGRRSQQPLIPDGSDAEGERRSPGGHRRHHRAVHLRWTGVSAARASS